MQLQRSHLELDVKQLQDEKPSGRNHYILHPGSVEPESSKHVQFSIEWSPVSAHYQFVSTSWGLWSNYDFIAMSKQLRFVNLPANESFSHYHCFRTYTLEGPSWSDRAKKVHQSRKSHGYSIYFWCKRNSYIRGKYCPSWRALGKWLANENFIRTSLTFGVINERFLVHFYEAIHE